MLGFGQVGVISTGAYSMDQEAAPAIILLTLLSRLMVVLKLTGGTSQLDL